MEHVYIQSGQIDNGNTIALAIFNSILSLLTESGGSVMNWDGTQECYGYNQDIRHLLLPCYLESGLLYPATAITNAVVNHVLDPEAKGIFPIDLASATILMSGLAPTLIIVRVAYGKSVDSVQQQVISIHLSEEASQRRTELDTSVPQAAMDIQSNPQTSNLEGLYRGPKA
ncbi:hypothetical protein PQX77_006531 [Marasmius sp. AFHP31]|nr:hypothetical protein PQX77_006531 [Marasmius sp. AFHP31]